MSAYITATKNIVFTVSGYDWTGVTLPKILWWHRKSDTRGEFTATLDAVAGTISYQLSEADTTGKEGMWEFMARWIKGGNKQYADDKLKKYFAKPIDIP